jgi:hypothetical protein
MVTPTRSVKPFEAHCTLHSLDFTGPDAFETLRKHLRATHAKRELPSINGERAHSGGWLLPSKAERARRLFPAHRDGGAELDVERQAGLSPVWAMGLHRRRLLLEAGEWLQTYALPRSYVHTDAWTGREFTRERHDDDRGRLTHVPGCPDIAGQQTLGGGTRYDMQWLAAVALYQLHGNWRRDIAPWMMQHALREPDWTWCPTCLGTDELVSEVAYRGAS